jgi:hypothetical protein
MGMTALVVMALCFPAPAQQTAGEPTRSDCPPTQFCTSIVSGDVLLVVGTVESVTLFGIGTAVVRLRIDEHLRGKGPAEGESVLLFSYAREFHAGIRVLLVLEPFRDGGRFRVRFRLDARHADYRSKLAMCRRQVDLMDLPDAAERDAATFDLLRSSLGSGDAWTRRYAVAELKWIADVHPEVLTPGRLLRLRSAGLTSRWPEVTDGVDLVAIQMARHTEALRARSDEESSSP